MPVRLRQCQCFFFKLYSAAYLPVVELVGHTLLNGSIGLDVDNITNLVGLQVGRKRNDTMFSKATREHVTSTSTNYIMILGRVLGRDGMDTYDRMSEASYRSGMKKRPKKVKSEKIVDITMNKKKNCCGL